MGATGAENAGAEQAKVAVPYKQTERDDRQRDLEPTGRQQDVAEHGEAENAERDSTLCRPPSAQRY